MIADGPCSVLRGGVMHGFPLEPSNGSRASTRDQLHLQHQYHQSQIYRNARLQQHQPAGSTGLFLRGRGSTQKAGKKSNQPLQYDMGAAAVTVTPTPSLGSTASESSVGRFGGGIESYNDNKCLPVMMNGTDLRSVSSLELSNTGEETQHSRFFRDSTLAPAASTQADWDGSGSVDSASFVKLLSNHLQPLPPPSSPGQGPLSREQTYPPPYTLSGSEPGLMHGQVFPPVHATELTTDMTQMSMQEWAHTTNIVSANGMHVRSGRGGSRGEGESGARGVRDGGGVGMGGDGGSGNGGGGGGGVVSRGNACSIGEPGLCTWTDMNSSDFASVSEGPNLAHDSRGKELWGVGGVGCGIPGARGEENPLSPDISDRDVRRDRRSSFDRLAAMIPGVPHHMQSPSSSPSPGPDNGTDRGTHEGTKPPSMAASAANITHSTRVGRPTARQMKPRKPRDIADARRQNKRVGSSKSCGPCLRGEPRDPAKMERRRAAIAKYIYKRSRRRFADSTRDQSPSRSRPKAAARRPRRFGKFVKVVKDFVPVTVASQGGQNMSATPTVAPTAAGGEGARGRVRGRHSGLKHKVQKVLGPIPGGALPITFDGISRPDRADGFLWSP